MSDAWQDTITNAVSDASSGLVTKWLLIAEVIKGDGTRQLETMYSTGAARWDLLGMLQVGLESIEDSDD